MEGAGDKNPSYVPYEERWEQLRPIIVPLFLGNGAAGGGMTIPQLASHMKEHYSFAAEAHQYRHRFRKWDVRKRTTKEEKEAIITALGKRRRPGASTSNVTVDKAGISKEVDAKQLRRHLNDRIRHPQTAGLTPGVFIQWNLPYNAQMASFMMQADYSSPFGNGPATPPYLTVRSPEATTPGGHEARSSPTIQLIERRTLQDRSHLFLQGRHNELLIHCEKPDRIAITNWLHDYWIYSFVSAKHWGKGPQQWDAELVRLVTLGQFDARTPQSLPSPAGLDAGMSPNTCQSAPKFARVSPPTHECRWVIHLQDDVFVDESLFPPQVETQEDFDLHDQSSWTPWPAAESAGRTLHKSMQESFAQGSFSITPASQIPIAKDVLHDSIEQAPQELWADACAFAIMAGNSELVAQQMRGMSQQRAKEIGKLHPFHLAATFLDGGHTCCAVLTEIFRALQKYHPVALNNIDGDGHTILDCLNISVLRSHTRVAPVDVSTSFSGRTRFPGEEKDICGRWDADSPAVRQLHLKGEARIPIEWKHPFCHSAAQAFCHSLIAIFGGPSAPNIDAPSGLFLRHCSSCGLKLALGPLHTMVIVAFTLANNGMAGETLFGALACLVCLLALGADPALDANISVADLLGSPQSDNCQHSSIDAAELAKRIPDGIIEQWSRECQVGWRCVVLILDHAKILQAGKPRPPFTSFVKVGSEMSSENDLNEETAAEEATKCELVPDGTHEDTNTPCLGHRFGTLWAAIQTELLTYRRISSSDPWISSNFIMETLISWLGGKAESFQTPLIEKAMMNRFSKCGWFFSVRANEYGYRDWGGPMASDVSSHYFMNMDIWSRTSFLERSSFTAIWFRE